MRQALHDGRRFHEPTVSVCYVIRSPAPCSCP
jgi:hypothetical protein